MDFSRKRPSNFSFIWTEWSGHYSRTHFKIVWLHSSNLPHPRGATALIAGRVLVWFYILFIFRQNIMESKISGSTSALAQQSSSAVQSSSALAAESSSSSRALRAGSTYSRAGSMARSSVLRAGSVGRAGSTFRYWWSKISLRLMPVVKSYKKHKFELISKKCLFS